MTAAATTLALALALGGCGGSDEAAAKTKLTVLAAASLTNAFGELRTAYQREHPDVAVQFSFGGSQQLAAQVREGSPVDVIATADEPTMTGIKEYVGSRKPFATNRLAIVVPEDNPKQVRTLADLGRSDVRVVLAGPTVPAGRYARQILDQADVTVRPKSEPADVRQVLTPLRLGEADAGVVYATNVTGAGGSKLTAVSIPAKQNLIATYPVATVDDSAHPREAKRFARWLRSEQATKVLTEHGFGEPGTT
ncbi:MAG: molybdate ABC transporter substrate-binding protein [Streptosporangiales bacterium]|nr:molybdate ABC transporter substrate-binding protein [Streptosporangiales bacterium]